MTPVPQPLFSGDPGGHGPAPGGKSIDDALELLDLMMSAELLGKAHRDADKENARRHPRLARASARGLAVEALFETAYVCGARASEACGMYVEDLDLRLDR